MTIGVCYHAVKSILDELETTEFSLGQAKIKRVAIIQFRIIKCCGFCGCSFQINIRPYATEVTNVTEAGFTKNRNLIVIGQVRVDYETEILGKVNWCQNNIRSKWKRMTGSLDSCCGLPMRRNSVFVGFKTSRCADIQFDME